MAFLQNPASNLGDGAQRDTVQHGADLIDDEVAPVLFTFSVA